MKRLLNTSIFSVLAAALLTVVAAVPSYASVTEGETAVFEITVTPKYGSHIFTHIRVWYETSDGTAVAETDYRPTYPWKDNHVHGLIGQPLTILVETFEDSDVEGDETFKIRIKKLEVGRFQQVWSNQQLRWMRTSMSGWNISGGMTATISDAP
ncbi:MAG: hypothetical protein OXC57_12045 [Rhodobacteraceae bacterium]|nr:hypothetical protein [Paracoccaceae bacterium]